MSDLFLASPLERFHTVMLILIWLSRAKKLDRLHNLQKSVSHSNVPISTYVVALQILKRSRGCNSFHPCDRSRHRLYTSNCWFSFVKCFMWETRAPIMAVPSISLGKEDMSEGVYLVPCLETRAFCVSEVPHMQF